MAKRTQVDGSRVLMGFFQPVHEPFNYLKTPWPMQSTEWCTIPVREFSVFPWAVSSQPPAAALIRSLNSLSAAELGTFTEAALHLKYHQHSQLITPSCEVEEGGPRGSGLDYPSMFGVQFAALTIPLPQQELVVANTLVLH